MKIAGPKLRTLHDAKDKIELQLKTSMPEEKVVSLHPATIRQYERYVAKLAVAFEDGISPGNQEAARAVRDLIEKIVVSHDPDGTLHLTIHGRLAALTEAPNFYPNMCIKASGD